LSYGKKIKEETGKKKMKGKRKKGEGLDAATPLLPKRVGVVKLLGVVNPLSG
jgi:hypothetical protein